MTTSETLEAFEKVLASSEHRCRASIRPTGDEILFGFAMISPLKASIVLHRKYGRSDKRGYRNLILERDTTTGPWRLESETFVATPQVAATTADLPRAERPKTTDLIAELAEKRNAERFELWDQRKRIAVLENVDFDRARDMACTLKCKLWRFADGQEPYSEDFSVDPIHAAIRPMLDLQPGTPLETSSCPQCGDRFTTGTGETVHWWDGTVEYCTYACAQDADDEESDDDPEIEAGLPS